MLHAYILLIFRFSPCKVTLTFMNYYGSYSKNSQTKIIKQRTYGVYLQKKKNHSCYRFIEILPHNLVYIFLFNRYNWCILQIQYCEHAKDKNRSIVHAYIVLFLTISDQTGPEVIKLFSCSAQLSMKFQLLINE